MSRLSILHAAKFYPPVHGGMERIIGDLCEGTASTWDTRVVAANDRPHTIEERVSEVDVVRAARFGSTNSVPICPSLAGHLWRRSADCVVLHEPNPIAAAALFVRTPAPKLIVWHHSDLLRPWWAPHTYGRVQRALYKRADCVIVSSPPLARHSSLVQCAQRIAVVPFGVAVERFEHEHALTRTVRARFPGPRVLFVGRLVYYKGVEVLIDAMARAAGTLLLIGTGPLEPELRARAVSLGIGDRVHFLGRVPDEELPAYYQGSDLFVLPSIAKTEAFGVVQIEAMAAGLPVVSTNLPTGVPWVNEDGTTGFVVPPGNVDALARAIDTIAVDGALRARFGHFAARRARDRFSRETMVRTFRDVIERVVEARDAVPAQAEVS